MKVVEALVNSSYNRLLVILVVILLGRPIWENSSFGALIFSGLTLLALFTLISSSLLQRRKRWLFFGVSSLAYLTQLLDILSPTSSLSEETDISSMIGLLINFALTSFFVYLIAVQLFHDEKVSADSIKGGICAYLLIGMAWSFLYRMAWLANPNSLQVTCDGCTLDFLYYSFTTLTTLGYGEIIPMTTWTRTLANLEALVGILYPTIYIARLVSMYSRDNNHSL
jgi:hypothetical protein